MTPSLVFVSGALQGKRFVLNRAGKTVLGRGPAADIQVEDPLVSASHLALEGRGDSFLLHDLASLNGTFLNGERVAKTAAVKPGDTIVLGTHECRFERSGSEELQQRRSLFQEKVDVHPLRRAELDPAVFPAELWTGPDEVEVPFDGSTLVTLHGLGASLLAGNDPRGLSRTLCRTFLERFDAERVILFEVADDGEPVARAVTRSPDSPTEELFPAARDTVSDCLAGGMVLRSQDIVKQPLPGGRETRSLLRTAACVPVPGQDGVRGAIYLEKLNRTEGREETTVAAPGFSEDQLAEMVLLCQMAGLSLSRQTVDSDRRRSEDLYRTLMEHSPQVLFTVDGDLSITYMNRAGQILLDLPGDEPEGLPVQRIPGLANAGRVNSSLRECLGSAAPVTFDLVFRKDNQSRTLKMDCFPVLGRQGEATAVFCQGEDVTEARRMEEMARKMERLTSLGQIVAGVAHELNNPLTSVVGLSDLLPRRASVPEELKSELSIIRKQALRAGNIVKDLQIFAGLHEPEKRSVSVNDLLARVVNLQKHLMEADGIDVVTAFDPQLTEVMFDPDQIAQVFTHLTSNAHNALRKHDGTRRLVVTSKKAGESVLVVFQDSGPGIPEAIRPRIFDPFFTTGEVNEGTGLGLAVTYGIVTNHGGDIRLESVPGKGATFTVELPFKVQPKSLDGYGLDSVPETEIQQPDRRKLTALAVDDDEASRFYYEKLLGNFGIHCLTAAGPDEAADILRQTEPFVVLASTGLPDGGVHDLYELVRGFDPRAETRVLFLVSDSSDAAVRDLLAQTDALHLEKPFTAYEFRRKLEAFFVRRGILPDASWVDMDEE